MGSSSQRFPNQIPSLSCAKSIYYNQLPRLKATILSVQSPDPLYLLSESGFSGFPGFFLSESEFPEFENFQNKVKVKTLLLVWFSFWKFSNFGNSDSDVRGTYLMLAYLKILGRGLLVHWQ